MKMCHDKNLSPLHIGDLVRIEPSSNWTFFNPYISFQILTIVDNNIHIRAHSYGIYGSQLTSLDRQTYFQTYVLPASRFIKVI
jgi:hypothetical protein